MMLPKVSILIPCYNVDRWIDSAIQSALDQTYSNKEVIVVDDGSTDQSLEIIRSFSDRIRWETQPNRGGNAARNRLLELSTGEWLQYLDADDYLQPNKIADQVAQIAEAEIIYSPSIFEFWDAQSPRQEVLAIPEPHDPWVLLARWYLPQTGSPLWKKSAIVEVGGWKVAQPCCQEHELYLRLLKAGKRFQYCSAAGSIYRQWSESTVCKKDKSEVFRQRFAILDAAEAHLQNIGELTALRQNAIDQARFECARIIWLSDRAWATQVIAKIDRSFIPTGQAAPRNYQWIYQRFGFAIAETIAQLRRTLTPTLS